MSYLEIQNYFSQKKEIYSSLISFIECNKKNQEHFQKLIQVIKNQKILQNPVEFKSFLYSISSISSDHKRDSNFNANIKQIIKHLEADIKQTFTNLDIIRIFQSDKLILLFQNDIIKLDEDSYNFIHELYEENGIDFYFYPEFKEFFTQEKRNLIEKQLLEIDSNIFTNFDQKRSQGENESKICTLIREDSIVDFIIYLNENNISPSSTIKPSFFETNLLILNNHSSVTLIEYAAFHGSIQIFQYLLINGAKFDARLFIYGIHSNNAEMINLLEDCLKIEYKINEEEEFGDEFDDEFYENVDFKSFIEESMKCHHNNITDYFINEIEFKGDIEKFVYKKGLKLYNFHIIPNDEEIQKMELYKYFIIYNYLTPVKILFNDKEPLIEFNSIYNNAIKISIENIFLDYKVLNYILIRKF